MERETHAPSSASLVCVCVCVSPETCLDCLCGCRCLCVLIGMVADSKQVPPQAATSPVSLSLSDDATDDSLGRSSAYPKVPPATLLPWADMPEGNEQAARPEPRWLQHERDLMQRGAGARGREVNVDSELDFLLLRPPPRRALGPSLESASRGAEWDAVSVMRDDGTSRGATSLSNCGSLLSPGGLSSASSAASKVVFMLKLLGPACASACIFAIY